MNNDESRRVGLVLDDLVPVGVQITSDKPAVIIETVNNGAFPDFGDNFRTLFGMVKCVWIGDKTAGFWKVLNDDE